MTSPTALLASGAPVTVGASAVLLTEYAPITIINTSVTNVVWLSDSSAVSPNNGVPLQPGTSFDWQATGSLYAVRDPAATGNVTVVLTNAVHDWQPNPVAIAAATAAQLASTGVPTKQTTQDLGNYSIGASGSSYLTVDFSQWQTVFLYITWAGSNALPVQYQWQIPDAGGTYYNVGQMDQLGVNDSNYVPGVNLPVQGNRLNLTNPNTFTGQIHIWGMTRTMWKSAQGNGFQSSPLASFVTVPALSAAGNYALTFNNAGNQAGHIFQGPAFLSIQVGGGFPTDYAIRLQLQNQPNAAGYLCDSSQFHTWPAGSGFRDFQGMVAFPAGAFDLYFTCQQAVGASAATCAVFAVPAYVI